MKSADVKSNEVCARPFAGPSARALLRRTDRQADRQTDRPSDRPTDRLSIYPSVLLRSVASKSETSEVELANSYNQLKGLILDNPSL